MSSIVSFRGHQDQNVRTCSEFYLTLPTLPTAESQRFTLDDRLFLIVDAVAHVSGVSLPAIFCKCRTVTVATARQVCCYLARKHTKCGYQNIASFFRLGCHSTVMCGERKIKNQLEQKFEVDVRTLVERAENRLTILLIGVAADPNPAVSLIDTALEHCRAAKSAATNQSLGHAKANLLETIRVASEALYRLGLSEGSLSEKQTTISYAV